MDHIYFSDLLRLNEAEKFLVPTDIVPFYLCVCGEAGVNKPSALPIV